MAVAPIRLPRFQARNPIVDREGKLLPSAIRAFNDAFDQIEEAVNSVLAIPEIQQALLDLDAATAAAQAAADNANAAAEATTLATALANSYVETNPLTATDAGTNATITVAAHNRIYGDGTTVAVSGGSITALSYETLYYVYYDQPSRAGGSVTYLTTTDASVAAQTGDRHVVGSALTPAGGAPPVDGSPVRPPGSGAIQNREEV